MQAELELQIAKVIRDVDGNNKLGASALAEHIAAALLSRFVLCDAEPRAWISTLPYGVVGGRLTRMPAVTADKARVSREPDYKFAPLYAPASLAGNANISPKGEAGKEGGE